MTIEQVAFNDLKVFKTSDDKRGKPVYGIKRHAPLHLEKLKKSIETYGFIFPIVVAELPNKDRWLIDGYARWEIEIGKKLVGGFGLKKYPAVIIPVKDEQFAKVMYLQLQSCYGTCCWEDFRNLDSETGAVDYELPGMPHINFDLSAMTREEVAEYVLSSKYQVL